MIIGSWIHRTRRTIVLTGTLALVALTGLVVGPAAPSQAATQGPCDIYAAGGTPCVAAHSTVRALYATYTGNLYQVKRASDGTTANIGVRAAGAAANAATQDSFCSNTTCVVTVVYDQSGHGNNLAFQGSGGAGGNDTAANATSESLTVAGSKVYSLYINPGTSYWHNGSSSGVPTGSASEGAYMVTSGTHVNSGCCFDYGNSEIDRKADGAGAMDAIYFGTSCWFGGCTGTGPWVQADLEYGLFPGGSSTWNPNQVPFRNTYVTAMLKNNGTTQFAIKGANAQSGNLTTLYGGSLPGGYNPMKQQGAIVLGSGGDCCATNTNQSLGTFYEGAIVVGYPSDATDNAVQANIVAAGYGSGATSALPTGWTTVANVTTGLVVDSGGNVPAGSALKQWSRVDSANLQWQFVGLGTGYYRIVNHTNGMVIDSVGNTTSGAAPVENSWTGGNDQQWSVKSLGNGHFQIVNRGTGLCLDGGGLTTIGSPMKMWPVGSSSNLQWTITTT